MGKLLFDIEANRGLYTDANKSKYDMCVLVEPNPVLANGLREKYKDISGFEIVEAIASKDVCDVFYMSNADTISTADLDWVVASRFTPNYRWVPVEGIPSITVDALIARFGIPDLIKIDVEGYEYNVLQSLTQQVPLICFEWAEEKKGQLLDSLNYLQKMGLTEFQLQMQDTYTFSPPPDRWVPHTEFSNFINLLLTPEKKEKWGMVWARVPPVKKRFLYVDTYNHHKNRIGFYKMCEAGDIYLKVSRSTEEFQKEWDLVWVPCDFIPHTVFPNAKAIMYGPHNFVFVNGPWKKNEYEFPPHCFYNLLSQWVIDVQNQMGGLSLASKAIPYAVDIDTFKPTNYRKTLDCFIYSKSRDPYEIAFVESILQTRNLSYKVIRYGTYQEEEYIKILKEAKFGIWIDATESQGFALEEALSMNVPLLVWDCTYLRAKELEQEPLYIESGGTLKLKGTTIPYWDNTCGLSFTEKEEFEPLLTQMCETYSSFTPRKFIEKNLSPKACIDRLLKELSSL